MSFRVGILACDHVDQVFLDKYSDFTDMFSQFVRVQDASIDISIFDLIGEQFPEDMHACDAYIITGSRFGVYEDIPWIHKAKQLVKGIYAAKIPTVGICFGHQLIATSLGGEVIKEVNKGRGLGVQTWKITNQADWMGDSSVTSLSLNAAHQDQVIKLPKGSKLFAGSDFCPIAGFEVGSMLTFQGHPEFDYAFTKYLVDKYDVELDADGKEKTQESMKIKPDSTLVGSWIIEFFKRHALKNKVAPIN